MNYKEFFLTDNKSGWKCVESKLKNKHPEIHKEVIEFSIGDLSMLPFKEKVWYFINNKKSLVLCSECNKKSKYLRLKDGYQEFCSVQCSNKNKDKIETTKDTIIKKYGVDCSLKIPEVKEKIKEINIEKYGVDNYFKSEKNKEQIKKYWLNKIGYESPILEPNFRKEHLNRTSKIEKEIAEKINGERNFILGNRNFDIRVGSDIFEIDGDYFHQDKAINLSLIQLNTFLNDKIKNDIVEKSEYNLYRIKVSEVKKLKEVTIENLKKISYQKELKIGYYDKIITKEFFREFINKNGKDKLKRYVPLLLKFIRETTPTLPYPTTKESLPNIQKYINNFDFNKIYNEEYKTFNNKCYSIGNDYLKSKFKSYWNSSYKNTETPIEIWGNDEKMLKIISYRIGINESNEVFDFSLNNLIRGISAIRGTVSFFKPLLASAIYKHYLGDIKNPIVFDPCCGFGGRLLGFKAIYPNGLYYGCEPNINTFNELCSLNFPNTFIYNTKLEDFYVEYNYDIAMTCIPYFDLEDYNNNVYYKDFDEWKNTFIKKLLSYRKLIVIMNMDICHKLGLDEFIDSYIENTPTHFSKSREKKVEVILKINF